MESKTTVKAIGKAQGFAQRSWTSVHQSPFLPPYEGLNFHRSPVTLKLIKEDIMRNCARKHVVIDDIMKCAINKTRHDFKLITPVKMLHLNDVFNRESSTWANSPGLPWKNYGYKTKGDIRRDVDAIQSVRRYWHYVKQGHQVNPPDCCAFVRSHIAKLDESKVRSIWGYPATITFGEAVFAVPLIDAYKQRNIAPGGRMAYGYEMMKGGANKIRNRFSGYGLNYTCMDFKNFDKTIPGNLIDIAFDILADNIDFVNYQDYGVADARRMIVMWKYLIKYFKETPIRLSNGERFRKTAGIASGSYFTQLIGSIVNGIMINYLCLKLSGSYPVDYIVMGDDSLFSTYVKIDFDDAMDVLGRYGMLVNVTKSFSTRCMANVKFLGYYLENGLPWKEDIEWYASLMLPERPDKEWDDVASRALGLMYAAMGINAQFHNLCYRIITFRPFDIHITSGMRRMFEYVLGGELPTSGIYNGTPPTWENLMFGVLRMN